MPSRGPAWGARAETRMKSTWPITGTFIFNKCWPAPDRFTRGAFPGQTNKVGSDALVAVYAATGKQLWLRQFGAGEDEYTEQVYVKQAQRYSISRVGIPSMILAPPRL